MSTPELFLGCDWGSTSFRLRLIEAGTRRVVAEQSAASGIKTFATLGAAERPAAMAGFLAERLNAWPDLPADLPIVISGMASSTVGWLELPYARTPFPLDGSGCQIGRVEFSGPANSRRVAWLVSGVRTDDDILRGEECALIGAHALHPAAARRDRPTLALLAGTHPKHARLQDGALVSFRTHLTGELFDALGQASLLAASIDRTAAGAVPDLAEFRTGVARGGELGLSAALFQVRARSVLQGAPKPGNTWFFSGLLLAAELERVIALPADTELLLVGDPLRVSLYREALRVLRPAPGGPEPTAIDLAAAVVAGQEVIFRRHAQTAAA